MTSNHHALYDLGYKRATMAETKRSALYDLGYKRATMAETKRSEAVMWSEPQKSSLSSD